MSNTTPSSTWSKNGEPDPHGTRYDCERAMLCKGELTDDELANALYRCDHRTSFESIGLITAAKDRIRWLSRKLEGPDLTSYRKGVEDRQGGIKRPYRTTPILQYNISRG